MRTKSKKIFALLVSLALFVSMSVPVFALDEGPTGPGAVESIVPVDGRRYMLNALTWGTPVAGTSVTVWENDASSTQRWRMETFPGTSFYWIKNGANPAVTVSYVNSQQAVLSLASSTEKSTQAIKFISEGMDGDYMRYGLALPDLLLALTATNISNGGAVRWLGSNGLTNQLWFRCAYFY